MLMISLGGAARAEGAVPSHYGVIALGRREACDLQLEAEAEGITTDHIIDQVLKEVPKDTTALVRA